MIPSGARLGILSISTGILMAASFAMGPPWSPPARDGLWMAGWICLTPVMVAAASARRPRAAIACGSAAGFVGFGLILCWIHPFLLRWAHLSFASASLVFGVFMSYLGSFVGAFALCVHLWSRSWGPRVAYLLAPMGWTALELIRGHLLTGFPWCLLGYSQHANLPAIQAAEITGVYGVSFVLAAASAAIACLFDRRDRTGGGLSRLAPWLLLAPVLVSLAFGGWRLRSAEPAEAGVSVALVQANVPQAEKWLPAERYRIEDLHFDMTRRAAGSGASIVIWSESSVPASLTADPAYRRRLEDLARETDTDILVGSVAYDVEEGRLVPYNSAFLLRADTGLAGRYDKLRLVPFGEYVPLGGLLFFLESLVEEASDFRPGKEGRPLGGRRALLGTLICYEAIFPELTREWVRAGARVLVSISNDSWYDETGMPRQHLAQSVLRAVEARRYLVRCASTGISAIVEPTGRIQSSTKLHEQTVLMGSIAPRDGQTVYAATGDLFAGGCAILVVLSLLLARRGASRR